MPYTTQDILFRSGDLFLPFAVRRFLEQYSVGSDTSLLYINNWSIVHLLSGVLTAYVLLRIGSQKDLYVQALLLHTSWELWQILGKNTLIGTTRGQLDVLMDTAFFMAGVWLYKRYGGYSRNATKIE
jgi:hypothetical protein